VDIWYGRRLFQVVASVHASALDAQKKDDRPPRPPVPICTLIFNLHRLLSAFWAELKTVYIISFSPAFIFENLARGPPAKN